MIVLETKKIMFVESGIQTHALSLHILNMPPQTISAIPTIINHNIFYLINNFRLKSFNYLCDHREQRIVLEKKKLDEGQISNFHNGPLSSINRDGAASPCLPKVIDRDDNRQGAPIGRYRRQNSSLAPLQRPVGPAHKTHTTSENIYRKKLEKIIVLSRFQTGTVAITYVFTDHSSYLPLVIDNSANQYIITMSPCCFIAQNCTDVYFLKMNLSVSYIYSLFFDTFPFC